MKELKFSHNFAQLTCATRTSKLRINQQLSNFIFKQLECSCLAANCLFGFESAIVECYNELYKEYLSLYSEYYANKELSQLFMTSPFLIWGIKYCLVSSYYNIEDKFVRFDTCAYSL